MGAEALLTVIVHCWNWVAPAATGWKPESTPREPSGLVKFAHGAAKVDWVTVWFFATL